MALAEYGNAFNIDTDGSGNPILVDPQSGDTIAIYDRGTSSWQVTTIEATTGDFDSVSTEQTRSDRVAPRTATKPLLYYDFTAGEGNIAYDKAGQSTILNYPDMGGRITTISGDPTDRHHFDPVHDSRIQAVNLSIDGAPRTYLAYDSNQDGDRISLYYSDSIDGQWTEYSGNPILDSSGGGTREYRWPTTTWDGSTLHMFLYDRSNVEVERWTSTDGINFTKAETVINGNFSNPDLYQDPVSKTWFLYGMVAEDELEYIKYRQANSLTGLTEATTQDSGLVEISPFAAPSLIKMGGSYWLTIETYPSKTKTWVTEAYYSDNPTGPWEEVGNNPIVADDDAVYVHRMGPGGNQPYGFVQHDHLNDTWTCDTFVLDYNGFVRGQNARIEYPTWANSSKFGRDVLLYDGSQTFAPVKPPRLQEYTVIIVSKAFDASLSSQHDFKDVSDNGIQMRYNSGQYEGIQYTQTTSFETVTAPAESDTWRMWTQRFDGSELSLWKDDNEADTLSTTEHSAEEAGDYSLGAEAPANRSGYLDGAQAAFILYPSAIPDADIKWHYDQLLGQF